MASGFNVSDVAVLRGQVEAMASLARDPKPLLKAWGVATLGWINETFKEGGRPKWVPLRPSTLAARRAPDGPGTGSGLPLQDNGDLRRSFDPKQAIAELTTTRIALESNNRTAVWHQYGTAGHGKPGGKSYPIRAKYAKALAIPGGPYTQAGLVRSTPTGRGGFVVGGTTVRGRKPGQSISPYAKVTFRREVTHFGVPPRPMLPTDDQIAPILERVGEKVLAETVKRQGRI